MGLNTEKKTCSISEKTDLHIVKDRMFNFRANGPSHCEDKHVYFQRTRTFTIVKFNMFNFSDNGPPMMTDMELCY